MVPGPGARDEQDAAFPLQVLSIGEDVLGFRGNGSRFRDQPLLDADNRDGLELQALHGLHGAGPDGRGAIPPAQRGRRDADGGQRLTSLADQGGGPGGHADRMRLDAGRNPRANPFGEKTELLGPAGRLPGLGARAVHGRAVAEQRVDLAVQTGHRLGSEQRHRPGQDLLGGPVVQGQPVTPATDVDAQAGEGDPVVVDALVWVGGDEQVVGAGIDGGAEQPPLGGVQVLSLVYQDVPVARCSRLPEQLRGLVGQLEVGGLPSRGKFGRDPLCDMPDLAALGLGQRPPPAGPKAGQVGLLRVQILRQDDLLPLVLQERGGERQPGISGSLRPASAQLSLVRDDGTAAGLLDDAICQPVHIEHLDPAAHGGIGDQQVKLGAERFGQVAVESGHQHRLSRLPGHEGRTMQHGHRLAGAGASRYLGRTGIAGAVGDLALARMQEHTPHGEGVGEDEVQFLLPGYEGDLVGSALHGGNQVTRIHLSGGSIGGDQPGDLGPGFVHGHPAGQRVKRSVLGIRQHGPQRFQVGLAGEQPDRRQGLRVDAEPGQVGVADISEQPGTEAGLQGWLQLPDGVLIAEFQHPQRLVDAEPVAGRKCIRFFVRQDRDQAIRIASIWC